MSGTSATAAELQLLAPPVPLTVGAEGGQLSRQSSNAANALGIRHRPLGKSGLRVPSVCLGTWVTLSSHVSDEAAEQVVVAAYENGINAFDVSEHFSGEQAEQRLGAILHRRQWRRSSYVVLTKVFWNSRGEERGLSRKRIIESVKNSLSRLQLEYIDVIIISKMDPKCPMEEVVRACSYCINQGWCMYWGTARWSAVEIFEAYSNCRQFNCVLPIVEQTEYHMFCRDKTELYMPEMLNKIGVGCMAWNPFSVGFVSGNTEEGLPIFTGNSFKRKYSHSDGAEIKNVSPRTAKKDETNVVTSADEPGRVQQQRRRELALVAARLGCSVAQLTTAWCLKNDTVHSLLVGATNSQQLMEQLHALAISRQLTAANLNELEVILSNKPVRYLPQSPIAASSTVQQ